MGRNVGRIGGAVAGIIAIIFGLLDVQDKVPRSVLITLGALAIAGVVLDYLWQLRSGGGAAESQRIEQKQTGGRNSTNYQAGLDININQPSQTDEL
ncbi:hypothetical protein JF781_21840 [Mycobacterium sp. WUMAC-067]|uniref:hypothetical protein n=1 Tax=unclassified Mycobacterium TaxID=2642494 RepID=UPI001CDA2176|nr:MULTISPECIES: hypothetical protein [unclassified Mycobacterium]MCA2245001.1 hypothetical protein [Mycobacterium sp. WUMAC-067]MCA2317003.1 hypothetical protein [Mycobacterium sp. WUMAC-025]